MSKMKTQETGSTDLKAERVQIAQVEERLKAERVQLRLKRMPGWGVALQGRGIDRVKDLGTAESAADYAGFVLRKAARESQVVRVELRGTRLVITVIGLPHLGARGGITENLLDFAVTLG
jgi:hypothetical protein